MLRTAKRNNQARGPFAVSFLCAAKLRILLFKIEDFNKPCLLSKILKAESEDIRTAKGYDEAFVLLSEKKNDLVNLL